jgi:hypothetical protein
MRRKMGKGGTGMKNGPPWGKEDPAGRAVPLLRDRTYRPMPVRGKCGECQRRARAGSSFTTAVFQ